ncbi:putative pyridoxal-phosphate-dependent aminotransferase protein [Fulvimarina pelagi HTCC2506]|uniref:Cysteine desulfurase n=1 Tax=Fulvimarina pelagi HTCC2506 TaxID=314231 RepID=Q0G706_9HYPH|nr:cysteine desulfurase family protein [Fulvimarina pelagi]EAU42558.1 putative pyridoxal-phosphate-dependent aminotransferase protein [Fulvimarina pelagi HTCC2506]
MAGAPTRIYLDCNATWPLRPEAREAMVAALDSANPSSVHTEGRAARALVEDARRAVADLVGANPGEVTFTSGASEAANMALTPDWLIDGKPRNHNALAVLESDHSVFLEGGRFEASNVTALSVDRDGLLRTDALYRWLDDVGDNAAILAIGLANSETGVVQDICKIAETLRGRDIRLVVDAAQYAGRLPLDFDHCPADAILLSSHKLGGPKGIGAIVLKSTSTRPFPLIRGGGQEKGRRSGTEPVPEIAGFGVAVRAASFELRNDDGRMVRLRDLVDRSVLQRSPKTIVLGKAVTRLPNTSAYLTPGLKSETAQIALDLAGLAVSAGSACSSGKVGRSHVVSTMAAAGLDIDPADGAVRVSFSRETSEPELMRFVDEYVRLATKTESKPQNIDHAA